MRRAWTWSACSTTTRTSRPAWPTTATDGPVIGVAFDGTGFGTDGTIWGGEFLVAGLAGFARGGHLAPVPMPGGTAAIRQPWRMAAAYLDAAAIRRGCPAAWTSPRATSGSGRTWSGSPRRGVHAPATSSAGRLFDAAAALLGVRDTVNYEGQAAIELEQLADVHERGAYRARIEPGEPFAVRGADLIRAMAEDLAAGTAARSSRPGSTTAITALIEEGCVLLRERHGLGTVALSGGVFQNLLLLHAVTARLEARGFRVLVHSRVPCNDGGISLGQAVIAAAGDRALAAASAGQAELQPVVPGLHPVAGDRGHLQHPRARAELPDVGRVPPDVEVHVGQQVGLADQHDVGPAEHVRVLDRLVRALGYRREHDPGRLAQVEQRRADQVAHVLDDDHGPGRGSSACSASATMTASRWQPTPVLTCTTWQPAELIRPASRAVSWSPSMTDRASRPARSRAVRSSSVVLPAPGELIRLTASTPRSRSHSRFRPASSSLRASTFCCSTTVRSSPWWCSRAVVVLVRRDA